MTRTQIIQDIYAAFGRGDIPAILERLAENVEWDQGDHGHGVPVLAPRRGRQEVAQFFASLSVLEFTRFEIKNVLEGGDQVIGVAHVGHRHKETGKSFEDLELHMWTFDAAGRIAAFRHFVDTYAVVKQFEA